MSSEHDIARDRWGRPLIKGEQGQEPVPYTRVSTLAKTLDDPSALINWKARMAVVGMARSPHLTLQVQGLDAIHDDPVSQARRDLNMVTDKAIEMAGGSAAASTGTALHAFTEAIDSGRKVTIPPEWASHIQAYRDQTSVLETVMVEQFVVNDAAQAAGTADRFVRLPDGRVVVADLKTGAHDPEYPLGVCTQLALYANGSLYDDTTGKRSPIHPDLDSSVGVLIHLPAKTSPATCHLYMLDLRVGLYAATLGSQVRALRKVKPIEPFLPEAS